MSTPGPDRVPSTVKVGKTSGQGKPPAGKPGSAKGPGSGSSAGKGKGKGRKPVTPVKVSGGRSWGPIAMIAGVVAFFLVVVGVGVFYVVQGSRDWEDKVAEIQGVVNYRAQNNPAIVARNHKDGQLTYVTSPPVGGDHNGAWMNCQGNVYTEPVANERAVHSLEHGAVWVTYKQGLAADQVAKLAEKVEGQDFVFMSPYAGLDKNVSVQVWGYQYKSDDVNDPKIEQFMKDTRLVASVEPGAPCSSGTTQTGPVQAAAGGATMGG